MGLELEWWAALWRVLNVALAFWLIWIIGPHLYYSWRDMEVWQRCRDSAVLLFGVYSVELSIEATSRDYEVGVSTALRTAILILLCVGVGHAHLRREPESSRS